MDLQVLALCQYPTVMSLKALAHYKDFHDFLKKKLLKKSLQLWKKVEVCMGDNKFLCIFSCTGSVWGPLMFMNDVLCRFYLHCNARVASSVQWKIRVLSWKNVKNASIVSPAYMPRYIRHLHLLGWCLISEVLRYMIKCLKDVIEKNTTYTSVLRCRSISKHPWT